MNKSHTQPKPTPSREDLSHVGLVAFFNIAESWELTGQQQQILLGNPARATFFKWKKSKQALLPQDVLERISYITGIYKALHVLLPSEQAANSWIKKPNTAPLFNGASALEIMLQGRVVDLADIRRYLDAERGW